VKLRRFTAALLLVGAIVWFYHAVLPVNHTTVALSLLMAVLAISAYWGLAEATLASVAGMLGFNYFFLPPQGTLTIEDPENWVALAAFLVTAITASQLSERARRRAAEAEERRVEVERLYALVQSVMLSGTPRHTAADFMGRLTQNFHLTGAAFYSIATDEIFRSGPESAPATEHDLRVAAELEIPSVDTARALALAPVRMGARPLGGLALVGTAPPPAVIRAIANLLAITLERARALEEASQAEAVRRSELLKSALLDALAHDIKTPLTAIKAASSSLLTSPRPPAETELLTIIDEEADRLNQIAAEVVAMARIEAGKLHLERRPVEVQDMVEAVLGELRPHWKGRPLRIEMAPDLPPADADPEFIQQVLKQLLDNALKYSPADSELTVAAVRKGARIIISVADRGAGIEENERHHIFDKFFRGRRHRFEAKGTGMGLPIAKGIVEAHGGRIWVESEPGQGSVFSFALPVHAGGRAA
jgi:two-component system, OmpR family, sensor histidine kinase KdpD